jgi:hypothetical protein
MFQMTQGLPYALDPNDPRAPSQEQWEAFSEAERRKVVQSLPADVPVAQELERERQLRESAEERSKRAEGELQAALKRAADLKAELERLRKG